MGFGDEGSTLLDLIDQDGVEWLRLLAGRPGVFRDEAVVRIGERRTSQFIYMAVSTDREGRVGPHLVMQDRDGNISKNMGGATPTDAARPSIILASSEAQRRSRFSVVDLDTLESGWEAPVGR
jgi:hypothetical protein